MYTVFVSRLLTVFEFLCMLLFLLCETRERKKSRTNNNPSRNDIECDEWW